jgi:cell division septal protein FtsQ
MVIVLCAAVLVVGLTLAATWPGFDPKNVLVAGNQRVSRSEIVAHAAIAANRSMWLQSSRAISKRIEAIPYVAAVAVHRLPPGTIMIVVSERVPFAVVQSGAEAAVVDQRLRVLTAATGDERLPIFALKPGLELSPGHFITQPDAVALRDGYDAMMAARVIPQQLQLDRFGGLIATMRGGTRVLFGDESDFGKKLTLVDPILAQVVRKGRQAATIDLRAPDTPVVVYR